MQGSFLINMSISELLSYKQLAGPGPASTAVQMPNSAEPLHPESDSSLDHGGILSCNPVS